jgi:hypothetical protein
MNLLNTPFIATHETNSLDAFVPELWAQESLVILEENMVAANLVHRDFEDEIADFGDIVNTRKPGEYTAKRKAVTDDVTLQDSTATNVAVPLDQHVHVSFIIRDAEQSKAFKDLVTTYLAPAMLAQARFIDQVVLGQMYQFIANSHGGLGGISSSNAKARILGTRNVMNKNKAHLNPRHMIWTPDSETEALNTEIFLTADKVGDEGTALREASLGRKLGFNHWMCQNMSSVSLALCDTVAGTVDNTSDEAIGQTAITTQVFSAAIANGTWFELAGYPYRVVSTAGGSTPTTINIAAPGLIAAGVDDAPITVFDPGTVDGAFAAGYSKYIAFDDFTLDPQVGQVVSFGLSATSAVYTIVEVAGATVLLDRPLEAALSNDDAMNPGPAGEYNFAFHRNALALVVRPLVAPMSGAGALSSVINHNGLSIRATIAYDHMKQGHVVTLDMLCGVKVLDVALGAVLLG